MRKAAVEVHDDQSSPNLGTLLSQVEDRKDSILISKDGKPVAALVDAEVFARINRIRHRSTT